MYMRELINDLYISQFRKDWRKFNNFQKQPDFLLIPPDFTADCTTDFTAVPQGLAQVQQFSKAARAE
jgi:hypothetical protein